MIMICIYIYISICIYIYIDIEICIYIYRYRDMYIYIYRYIFNQHNMGKTYGASEKKKKKEALVEISTHDMEIRAIRIHTDPHRGGLINHNGLLIEQDGAPSR